MASKSQAVKTLSKAEQKKSIKGVQKSKKNAVKNTLESPFSLDWPVIDVKHEEEIRSLLEKSCSGLKKSICKPPWREVQKYKGTERKDFLKDFKQKFQVSLDPDAIKQNKEREDALSNLIIGYNAVMRALEKDRVSGILVKKNVEPSFIVKTFLPGCANKYIPLIPLNDLDGILKHEDTLALPHTCMALGLKHTVVVDTNRFYLLYSKMCEAVNIDLEDLTDEESEEQMECTVKIPSAEDNKENNSYQYLQVTSEQIQSYHLKRIHKNKRVFIPGEKKDQQEDSKGTGSDFIGFGSAATDEPPELKMGQLISRHCIELNTTVLPKNEVKQEISQSVLETEDFSSLFLIDETGDGDVLLEEEPKVKEEDFKEEKFTTAKLDSSKRKRKLKEKISINQNPYVSAKTKRVKSNPNREEKRKT